MEDIDSKFEICNFFMKLLTSKTFILVSSDLCVEIRELDDEGKQETVIDLRK